MKNKKSAFTLIELSATIVIVGLLVIGVMSFSGGIINAVKNFKEKYPSFSHAQEGDDFISWDFTQYPSSNSEALAFAKSNKSKYGIFTITDENGGDLQVSDFSNSSGNLLTTRQLEVQTVLNPSLKLCNAGQDFTLYLKQKITTLSHHGNWWFSIGDNLNSDENHIVFYNSPAGGTGYNANFNNNWGTGDYVNLGNYASGQLAQIVLSYKSSTGLVTIYHKFGNSASIGTSTYTYLFDNSGAFALNFGRPITARYRIETEKVTIYGKTLSASESNNLFE